MTGWIILCIFLLTFSVLLLTPVQARASYDGGKLSVQIRYGPLRMQLYPRNAAGKKRENGKPKRTKKTKRKQKPEKAEKPKAKINREQIFYTLEKLPPVLAKALKRVGRRITLTPVKICLLIAGSDPADTAQLYGRLTVALANGLPILQRTVHIREQDIRLYPDFTGERMDCAADVGVSIRPWDVLVIGVCAGAGLFRWLLGFRRLASPPPAEENDTAAGKEAVQDETPGEAA